MIGARGRTEHLEGRHETSRLTGFTDAVAAVSLTVLVLPLVDAVDSATVDLTQNPIEALWRTQSLIIVSFAANFYIIMWFWIAHNRVFGLIEFANPRVVQLAFCWIVGIVAVPVAGNILAQIPVDETGSGVVYVLLSIALYVAAVMLATEYLLRKNRRLCWKWVTDEQLLYVRILFRLLIVFTLILMALAVITPEWSINAFMLICLIGPLALLIAGRMSPPDADKSRAALLQTLGEADRVKNFSDGVVAVALTLLVLPLCGIKLPSSALPNATPFLFIWDQDQTMIVSCVVSFGLVAWFWLVHHRLMATVKRVDGWLLIINGFWLFGVVSLPWVTEVLATTQSNTVTTGMVIFYLCLMAYLGVSIWFMALHVARSPKLWSTEMSQSFRSYWRMLSIVFIAYMAMMLILALTRPSLALWAGASLFVLGPIAGGISHQLATRKPATLG